MASTAEKLDPELWEEAKADARAAYGGHSARAMQYASKLYKARGGRYKGRKRADNRLTQWTRQDWTTKSGRPSRETGERYLPRAAIESLSSAEYGATTRAKRRGGGVGSVVAQPQSIREKTRKFRKVNPMATAKQIAARKRFAEMARSGELAKMRKKATKRNPTPTKARAVKSNPEDGYRVITYEGLMAIKNWIEKTSDRDEAGLLQGTDMQNLEAWATEAEESMLMGNPPIIEMSKTVTRSGRPETFTIPMKFTRFIPYDDNPMKTRRKVKTKRNPTATRAPERSRTKLVENGDRKKNPIHGYTVMCGRSGRILGYADTLPMAKAMATSIANDRNMQVKIEKN
jgi:hypothetical protein